MVAPPLKLRFDAFELDEANARLTRAGQPVALAPKALAVLCALGRQSGQLVTKNALLDAVWGHQHVSESVLKTLISELRAALGDDAKKPRYIETASRHGYRFIGATLAAPAGLPPSTPATSAEPLIGRLGARAKLHETWHRVQAGEGQLVWVAGEAGVGKTTLIESFAGELGADVVAYGHCIEHFGAGEPYLPLLEALRDLSRRDPELALLMRAVAPTWVLQMPWLINEADRAELHRELSGTHPDRMVRELLEFIDRYTAERPLVLVLEDLHWSDLATLRVMEHFAIQQRPGKLLWIASFRLTQVIAEDHPLRDLRQELKLKRLCAEILLDPFSEREVGDYLTSRLAGKVLPENFVRRLHAHTEGLPLFVANVIDTLMVQTTADAASMETWLQKAADTVLPVPDSLSGAIEKQVRRLPAPVQRMLEAASVCGMEFRAGLVAEMLAQEEDTVRESCDDLVRGQLWLRDAGIVERPDGNFDSRYTFRHALYQHVFGQRMATPQRIQLHRKAARTLGRLRRTGEEIALTELASHLERGHETAASLKAYADAAANALGRFAPRDAINLSRHGLQLLLRLPPGDERNECEFGLQLMGGVASCLLHGIAAAESLAAFERVRDLYDLLPETPARATALNGLGWIFYVRGDYDPSLDLALRMEQIGVRHADALLSVVAWNLIGVSLIAQGKLEAGCGYLERGIEGCAQLPDDVGTTFVIDPEVSMRMNIAFPLYDRGLEEQARRHLKIGIDRAHRIGQPAALMLSNWCGGMVEVRADNPAAVAVHAANIEKHVQEAMLTQGEGPGLWLRGWARAKRGEPHAGYEDIMAGYECHARFGMYSGCPEVLGYATEALILAEDWPAARQQIESALQLAVRINERHILAALHLLASRVALATEDAASATESLRAALAEAREQGALGVEVQVLVALRNLPEPQARDLKDLQDAVGRMTEGHAGHRYAQATELLATAG